ncbi:flavodoxin family protein [Dyella caseinilytica]|uniref:flavodoxin family protein n=1 Tax=Dyella caseinilytica TaxID=1849581 RepID=UPI00308418FA
MPQDGRHHGHRSETIRSKLEAKGYPTQVIHLASKRISSCDGCERPGEGCNYRTIPCTKQDDMTAIIPAMIEADILIYACPVHAFGTSNLMQLFLERAGVGYLRFNRPLANKIGGIVIVGRKYNLGNVHDQILNNMLLNRMIVPGSGFPVLVHGDESTRSIPDAEEIVALDQLLDRLVEVSASINTQMLRTEWENERQLISRARQEP